MTEKEHTDSSNNAEKPSETGSPDNERKLIAGKAAEAYKKQAKAGESSKPEAQGADESAAEESASEQKASEADKAMAEIAELKDLLLRKAAEFDNYRKRVQRERDEFRRFAASSVIEELLPVLDNFELAISAGDGADSESYQRGVEMIHKQFLETLQHHGLEPIQSLGEQFDPHVHEAVIHEPSTEHEEGEIIEEMQRGYTLGDRVLRPAKVKVAAEPEDDSDDDGERIRIEIKGD